jgi:molybdenum cofactor synthesis domain-containing protein
MTSQHGMVQLPAFPRFATMCIIVMPAAGEWRALSNDDPATVLGVISLDVARERVLGALQRLEPREISCADATGLVLANDVVAPENVPPFANTAVDGFAVRTDDLREVPCDLRVIGTLAAGDATEWTLNPGEALRIMTGAVMPLGADAVVMVEDAEVRSESTVRISKRIPIGAAVRPVADDVREGEVVFPSGTVVTPAGAGVLASVNAHRVMAYPRAKVAVLSTGDELVTDGSPLRRGQIRESNLTMLEILLKKSECEVMNVGVVADDPTRLEQVLLRVANECDAIVTSGGVSMGDFDVVKMVLSRIADMQWMQLAIKPAKPFAFGLLSVTGRQVPVFGLPGNPVSSLISFELLARPALRHMMGHTHQLVRPSIRAIADVPLRRKPDGKVHFMRVIGHFAEDGRLHIRDAGPQGSHQLAATAAANGLAVVSDGEGVPAGHEVEVILIN